MALTLAQILAMAASGGTSTGTTTTSTAPAPSTSQLSWFTDPQTYASATVRQIEGQLASFMSMGTEGASSPEYANFFKTLQADPKYMDYQLGRLTGPEAQKWLYDKAATFGLPKLGFTAYEGMVRDQNTPADQQPQIAESPLDMLPGGAGFLLAAAPVAGMLSGLGATGTLGAIDAGLGAGTGGVAAADVAAGMLPAADLAALTGGGALAGAGTLPISSFLPAPELSGASGLTDLALAPPLGTEAIAGITPVEAGGAALPGITGIPNLDAALAAGGTGTSVPNLGLQLPTGTSGSPTGVATAPAGTTAAPTTPAVATPAGAAGAGGAFGGAGVDPVTAADAAAGTSLISTGAGAASGLPSWLSSLLGSPGALGAGLGALGGLLGGSSSPSGTITTVNDIPDWMKPYAMQGITGAQSALSAYRPNTALQQAAADEMQKTIQGDYYNANPYLDAAFNQAAGRVGSTIDSRFTSAGRYGSGAHQGVLGTTLGDLATNIYGGNYQQERARQAAAAQAAPSYLTQASQAAFAPYSAYKDAINYGGSQQTSPYFTNQLSNLFGGALTGYTLGNLFK